MILSAADWQQPVEPGGYAGWGGKPGRLHDEVTVIGRVLRSMLDGEPVALNLYAAPDDGVWIGDARPAPVGDEAGKVILFTSGTTGTPKRVERIVEPEDRAGSANGERWLYTYSPYRWAGLSMLLHVLRRSAELAVPVDLDTTSIANEMHISEPTHVGWTPSQFRKLLMTAPDVQNVALEQVTFGGEAVNQATIDLARATWPAARVTHVYASSELGDVFSVSDGRAGVPADKMTRDGRSVDENGQLVVNGFETGDYWQRNDDRFEFVGRAEEIINVGGDKVAPLLVENEALQVEGVEEARAYGVESPVLGQLVALDYVGTTEEAEVRSVLRSRLPRTAVPAKVQRLEEIRLTAAGKIRRMESS